MLCDVCNEKSDSYICDTCAFEINNRITRSNFAWIQDDTGGEDHVNDGRTSPDPEYIR